MNGEELKEKNKQAEGTTQQTEEQDVTEVKEVRQQTSENKPLQAKQVSEESEATVQQVTETPKTSPQGGRVESAAGTSGQVFGAGLRKVRNMIDEFTGGISKGMKAGQPPKQGEQQVKQQQIQQAQEAPKTNVTEEEEKIKKKEVRQG